MSWNHSQEHTRISFDRVVPEEELRSMLSELAINLLEPDMNEAMRLDQLEDIGCEIENGT